MTDFTPNPDFGRRLANFALAQRATAPEPAIDDVAADMSIPALELCRLLGGHTGEGHVRNGWALGRCQRCGLGLATDGDNAA